MKPWKNPESQLQLGKDTVDIWRVNLNVDAECFAGLEDFLSIPETDQARRFHFERDRRRYIVSHAALRLILSRYVNIAPQDIDYLFSRHGKPSLLAQDGVCFNLAHSHEMALIAVTALGEIGVDIEHIRPVDDIESIARHSFSDSEFNRWQSLPGAKRLHAFFHYWCRKEAFIKALDEGLSYPLQQFSVVFDTDEESRLESVQYDHAEAAQWTLKGLDVGRDDYAAAYAVRTDSVQERLWNMSFNREVTHVSC